MISYSNLICVCFIYKKLITKVRCLENNLMVQFLFTLYTKLLSSVKIIFLREIF